MYSVMLLCGHTFLRSRDLQTNICRERDREIYTNGIQISQYRDINQQIVVIILFYFYFGTKLIRRSIITKICSMYQLTILSALFIHLFTFLERGDIALVCEYL